MVILVTTLILICTCISNYGIFFALDEESPMEKGRLESMLTLVNDNLKVGFFWFSINFEPLIVEL